MKNKNYLFNVVIYDGASAFITRFIGIDEDEIIEQFESLGYDGEILKIDKLYDVSFDNILAFKECEGTVLMSQTQSDEAKNHEAAKRFIDYHF